MEVCGHFGSSMKRILSLLLLSISINVVHAQFDENHAIYSTGEFNVGNYIGLDLNLNYVFKEKYSVKMGYSANIRKTKSQPDDYSTGLSGLALLGLIDPYDFLENYQIGVGKVYNLNQNGTIRLNATVGLGYTIVTEPANWKKLDSGFENENYSWNYRERNTISLILNPKIEFPFTRVYGITISPMIQINKHTTYVGIGVGKMIGLLRGRLD